MKRELSGPDRRRESNSRRTADGRNQRNSVDEQVSRRTQLQRSIGNQAVQRLYEEDALQPKLRVSQPDDKHEREAERAAESVMRMENPKVSSDGSTDVQRRAVRQTPAIGGKRQGGSLYSTSDGDGEVGLTSIPGQGNTGKVGLTSIPGNNKGTVGLTMEGGGPTRHQSTGGGTRNPTAVPERERPYSSQSTGGGADSAMGNQLPDPDRIGALAKQLQQLQQQLQMSGGGDGATGRRVNPLEVKKLGIKR